MQNKLTTMSPERVGQIIAQARLESAITLFRQILKLEKEVLIKSDELANIIYKLNDEQMKEYMEKTSIMSQQ